MKFRKHADNPETDAPREEMRNLAEALSLYRSAMHHVAERETALHPIVQGLAQPRPKRTLGLRLLLAPALAAAVAAGVLLPLYAHFHHPHSSTVAVATEAEPTTTEARVNIDDSVLMNQIDSDLSEDVPDALQPLADLSYQAATTQATTTQATTTQATTTTNSVSEKKNATQE